MKIRWMIVTGFAMFAILMGAMKFGFNYIEEQSYRESLRQSDEGRRDVALAQFLLGEDKLGNEYRLRGQNPRGASACASYNLFTGLERYVSTYDPELEPIRGLFWEEVGMPRAEAKKIMRDAGFETVRRLAEAMTQLPDKWPTACGAWFGQQSVLGPLNRGTDFALAITSVLDAVKGSPEDASVDPRKMRNALRDDFVRRIRFTADSLTGDATSATYTPGFNKELASEAIHKWGFNAGDLGLSSAEAETVLKR